LRVRENWTDDGLVWQMLVDAWDAWYDEMHWWLESWKGVGWAYLMLGRWRD
jgi:hypothetical protein